MLPLPAPSWYRLQLVCRRATWRAASGRMWTAPSRASRAPAATAREPGSSRTPRPQHLRERRAVSMRRVRVWRSWCARGAGGVASCGRPRRRLPFVAGERTTSKGGEQASERANKLPGGVWARERLPWDRLGGLGISARLGTAQARSTATPLDRAPQVTDTAFGGGTLVLSELGSHMSSTFCAECYRGEPSDSLLPISSHRDHVGSRDTADRGSSKPSRSQLCADCRLAASRRLWSARLRCVADCGWARRGKRAGNSFAPIGVVRQPCNWRASYSCRVIATLSVSSAGRLARR